MEKCKNYLCEHYKKDGLTFCDMFKNVELCDKNIDPAKIKIVGKCIEKKRNR